jgi:oxygen-independent coproporphyrinogen-3 oxidase
MNPLERAEERVLMGLRTDEGVALAELGPLPLSALPELVESGHLVLADGRIRASAAGRLVLDRLTQRLILS